MVISRSSCNVFGIWRRSKHGGWWIKEGEVALRILVDEQVGAVLIIGVRVLFSLVPSLSVADEGLWSLRKRSLRKRSLSPLSTLRKAGTEAGVFW